MALVLTPPLTRMSARNRPGAKAWPAREADNLTIFCKSIIQKNVGSSTSQNSTGFHGQLYS
jgi:hypothetical protein